MALESQSIKNLKGGISQQPDILRYPNQGVTQVNGWSSETQGLQKRPPTTFVKRLAAQGAWGNKPLVHLVNRDAVEQYYVVFTGKAVHVSDLKGNLYEVRGYDSYGNCKDPREDLRLITIADYTFVVNRKVTVKENKVKTHAGYPSLTKRALVAVRGGQYGRTLKVTVNGTILAEYLLPPGVGEPDKIPDMVKAMDAQHIATELAKQINAKTATSGVKATVGPAHILLVSTKVIDTLKTEDGYGDQLINGFIYQIQTFNKLPNQAPEGYLVEITGEATRTGDNYWVRCEGNVWKETVKPGITEGLDAATMPRALVRAADGNFDWKVLDWVGRKAGDDETNPMPSFVGGTLNDVFFFRNRLGFLSSENVVMTRTARYFNFFPPSVSSISDDDPIDVAVSHNRISILKYAVPFAEQLLLWSDQAQFVLSSAGTLSVKTVELNLTTEFDVQDTARPFGIGRGVYFSAPRAAFTSIKRYYAVQDVSDVKNAEDVSAHVPSYIANKVFNIHGSGTENYVTILSDGAPDRTYVYKFLYIDENVAQQSWSHWEYGQDCKVLATASIGSYMYILQDRTEGIVLERVEFTEFTTDYPSEPYRAYSDGKLVTKCDNYDPDEHHSTINLLDLYGGLPHNTTKFWTVDPEGVAVIHEAPKGGWAADPKLYLLGDQRDVTFSVGRQFLFHYEFSKFLIKQTDAQGGVVTEDAGRFQLRKAWVNYESSGAFTISVDNRSSVYSYLMAGGRLGSEIRLGEPNLGTGQFRFAVSGNALRQKVSIKSDTPGPLNVIGCGFEGNYIRRSRGI